MKTKMIRKKASKGRPLTKPSPLPVPPFAVPSFRQLIARTSECERHDWKPHSVEGLAWNRRCSNCGLLGIVEDKRNHETDES